MTQPEFLWSWLTLFRWKKAENDLSLNQRYVGAEVLQLIYRMLSVVFVVILSLSRLLSFLLCLKRLTQKVLVVLFVIESTCYSIHSRWSSFGCSLPNAESEVDCIAYRTIYRQKAVV